MNSPITPRIKIESHYPAIVTDLIERIEKTEFKKITIFRKWSKCRENHFGGSSCDFAFLFLFPDLQGTVAVQRAALLVYI